MSTQRQKIQLELAFPVRSPGEPVGRTGEGPEGHVADHRTQSPAMSDQLMEEILVRGNLKKALKRVQSNKGAPGIDGVTVDELPDYLREHWPTMREQLLEGTYKVSLLRPAGPWTDPNSANSCECRKTQGQTGRATRR